MVVQRLGLTELADKCNVSTPTLKRAMRGEELLPKTIGKISKGLNKDIDEVLRGY